MMREEQRQGLSKIQERDNKRHRGADIEETVSETRSEDNTDSKHDVSAFFNSQFSRRKARQKELENDSSSSSPSRFPDRQSFSSINIFSVSHTSSVYRTNVQRNGKKYKKISMSLS